MFILPHHPSYTLAVLPKWGVVTVKTDGNPNATGVFVPKPLTGSEGSLTRPFHELVEYLQAGGDTIELWPSGEMLHRPPYIHVRIPYRCDEPLQSFTVYFRRYISPFDQTYTCLVRAPAEAEGGLRCAYRLMLRRVRMARRVALCMGSHDRLGQASPLRWLDHVTLGVIASYANLE